MIRRNESCQGLCKHNTVGTCFFQFPDVADGEFRAFFQKRMQKLRFVIAEHHGFTHIHQAPRKAEGTDGTRKNGSVLYFFHSQLNCFYESSDSSGINRRYGQCFRFFHGGNRSTPHGGHFVVEEADLRTEGFCLYGKVHEADCRGAVAFVRHQLHAVRLKPAAVNKLPHRYAFHVMNSGERQNGERFFVLPGNGVFQPVVHIQ